MDREWNAWREVCAELEALGIDINEQDKLNGLLVRWGKTLVALRKYQEKEGI
jgi:hypothetical protein